MSGGGQTIEFANGTSNRTDAVTLFPSNFVFEICDKIQDCNGNCNGKSLLLNVKRVCILHVGDYMPLPKPRGRSEQFDYQSLFKNRSTTWNI